MALPQPGKQLRELFARKDKVLSIFGIPNALHAMIMEKAGMEAGFVGGAGTTGNYTGFSNTGMASMTELVMIGGYIARSVSFPVILDGDVGPGSFTAIYRLVEDCIRAGIACLRFEDQPPGIQHKTNGKIEILPRKEAVARYRVAVEARDALDPNFVIGAKTYARDAHGGGVQEGIDRLNLYLEAGVDTVAFRALHSIDEVREVRAKVPGLLAVVGGPEMTLEQHAELGLPVAWFSGELSKVLQVASWEFLNKFQKDGYAAWKKFQREHYESLEELKLTEIRALGLLNTPRQADWEAKYLE